MTTKERRRAASKGRKQSRVQARKDKATQKRIAGVYYPVANPGEFFPRIGKLRKDAEIAIDRLLAFVDALDDATPELDADLEPTLGSTLSGYNSENHDRTRWASSKDADEREPDNYENEDGGDDEHSLGSVAMNQNITQVLWAAGDGGDYEDEHDGAEPDVEAEPLLGATLDFDQLLAWHLPEGGEARSCEAEDDELSAGELDFAEHGIADDDGMLEQFGLWCGGFTSGPRVLPRLE